MTTRGVVRWAMAAAFVIIVLGASLAGIAAEPSPTSMTVVTMMAFGPDRASRELDEVRLASLAVEEEGSPVAVALTWSSNPDSLFSGLTDLRLQSDVGLLPEVLSPEATPGISGSRQLVDVKWVSPKLRGDKARVYQTRLSYNAETGDLAILVVDTATTETVYRDHLRIKPFAGPVYAESSRDRDQQNVEGVVVTRLLTADPVFVPASADWQLGSPQTQTAVGAIQRHESAYLTVDLPDIDLNGVFCLRAYLSEEDTTGFQELVGVTGRGRCSFPVDLSSLQGGQYVLRLEYIDEFETAWPVGEQHMLVVDGNVTCRLEIDECSADLITGTLRLDSKQDLGSLGVSLEAHISRYSGGRWERIHQDLVALEQTVSVSEGSLYLPFSLDRPDQGLLQVSFDVSFDRALIIDEGESSMVRTIAPLAAELPSALWKNVADYNYMYFPYGLKGQLGYWPPNPEELPLLCVETNRYSMCFDYRDLTVLDLRPVSDPLPAGEALVQSDETVSSTSAERMLQCYLIADGQRYQAVEADNGMRVAYDHLNTWLVEGGRYLYRRYVPVVRYERGAPRVDSNFEMTTWPDRLSFTLSVVPESDISGGSLEMVLDLPDSFSSLLSSIDSGALFNSDGSGFVLMSTDPSAEVSVDSSQTKAMVTLDATEWKAGHERKVGLVIYPASSDIAPQLPQIEGGETGELQFTALQVEPTLSELGVQYDREYGWYRVGLRNDGSAADSSEAGNDRIERVIVTIANTRPYEQTARINFAKDGPVFGITGISATLRDCSGNPLGIPVQVSKNWHRDERERVRYEGTWYHGIAMMTVPAESSVSFEYISVNGHWGGVPAASVAQLALMGWPWGGNHQWDQTAIGSWGESMCFEPEPNLSSASVCDVRPVMAALNDGAKWGWTGNVGGADFLVYYDPSGRRQFLRRVKTMYESYCPNLAKVIYAGETADGAIESLVTVSLYRTDDVVRGLFRIRYDVKEPVDFSRLVFFQAGADDYSYTREKKFAFGDENGLIKEWDPSWGGRRYRTERMELDGEVPWFSMHEAIPSPSDAGKLVWANRGIILRKWDAVLGGQSVSAYAAEYGANAQGINTSLIDIVPPPSVDHLEPGDYVEAEIELVIMPQSAEEYYGPNRNLERALATHANTWRMIYREAIGNDLEVTASCGEVVASYPIAIRVSEDESAAFEVTGGLGYVPVTFTGLSGYRHYRLMQDIDGELIPVDQSVHGNDFWQADYDSINQSWNLTYSIPLDSPDDERRTARFVFSRR